MGNSFGERFILTSFGESHGEALGGVIDGCPAGLQIDIEAIDRELSRRRPGSSELTTQRHEADAVEFLSGLYNGTTTGTPIGFITRNHDRRSSDYDSLLHIYRPGHADYTYDKKYGHRDPRGGGRASGRESVVRVVGGAIAKQLLSKLGVEIKGFISGIGNEVLPGSYTNYNLESGVNSTFPCPDNAIAERMKNVIHEAKSKQDSIGGEVTIVITGVPVGWGEPVFDKLQARLAYGICSIGGVKGFEYGEGFNAAHLYGSQMNDSMQGNPTHSFKSNHAGGILGGISNGDDIYFKVAFKPTPSIGQTQKTINDKGANVSINIQGRHDPCIVPRALVVVESMAALTLYDAYLMSLGRIV